MLLHLLSDIHLELEGFRIPQTPADVIILAGDIGNGVDGIEWACQEAVRLGKTTIYVAGNHEYYHGDICSTEISMREAADAGGIHFLNNESALVGDVRFLGTTLWTDYRAPAYGTLEDVMAHCGRAMPDHTVIKLGDRKFKPEDAQDLHCSSVSWLKNELARETAASHTVVITHHAPSLCCAHPEYGLDMTSGSFVSDLDWLIPETDLWCFGHTHACFDDIIQGTRVVSNARGYPFERTFGFDASKVIDIREDQ